MCTALVAVVASVSGLNVAQQQLAVDLGATQSQLLWVINGYTIALAALLLPIGAIGDRWGRKHVLVAGPRALRRSPTSCAAFAGSVNVLLVSRIAAGVGAAMIMPVTLSVITSTFPAEDRDRAVGVWAGFAGAGGILGLVTSSIVVDNFTWPWVFAMPDRPRRGRLRHDRSWSSPTPGSTPRAASTSSARSSRPSPSARLVLAIHEGPEVGLDRAAHRGRPDRSASLGAAWFAWWELRQRPPAAEPAGLPQPHAGRPASVSLLAVFAIMMALFLVLVQFLQAVLGYSAIKASVSLLPHGRS